MKKRTNKIIQVGILLIFIILLIGLGSAQEEISNENLDVENQDQTEFDIPEGFPANLQTGPSRCPVLSRIIQLLSSIQYL